ncbi:MAG: hypothetical protein AVDCRST_MAG67-4396, partial [uncultured Solirubrobacteraceae bacterium]
GNQDAPVARRIRTRLRRGDPHRSRPSRDVATQGCPAITPALPGEGAQARHGTLRPARADDRRDGGHRDDRDVPHARLRDGL